MTIDDYRQALEGLTPEEFKTFRERWGGTSETVDSCVQEFAYSKDGPQLEQAIVFHLRRLGVSSLRTESEKASERAERSAAAAVESAAAARVSAEAARGSNRAAWWSQVIALLAIIATLSLARC